MAIEYTMEKRGDILFVEVWGFDESLEEAVSYNNAVRGKAEALGCRKVLCDERDLEYRLSVVDTYKLGEHTARIATSFARIAIVTSEPNQEAAEFWENVTKNRGVMARVFYTVAAAQDWLEIERRKA
jgi:hypothetical protein